jgi:hypothetical protein
MPQTTVFFAPVAPSGTAVKFISGEGSLHSAYFSSDLNPNATILEQQHVGDEADEVFHRHIVIHQLRQPFSKNISNDKNHAQHRDREQYGYQ